MRFTTRPALLALLVALAPAAALADDETVIRALSPDQVETLLKGEKLDFQKSSTPKRDVHFYDFARGTHRLRLTWYSAAELMLDSAYKALPVDKVNEWNRLAKYSRASLHQDKDGAFVLLEYNLDLSGGVTAAAVKQFLTRFEEELAGYEKFAARPVDTKVLPAVTPDVVEGLLTRSKLTFDKKVGASGAIAYDFAVDGHKLRLYHRGGKTLSIDAVFKALDLERVNEFNLSRKFIRVVSRGEGAKAYTTIEANLDCEAGVTEGMIRHFIQAFAEDVKSFAEFTQQERAAKQ